MECLTYVCTYYARMYVFMYIRLRIISGDHTQYNISISKIVYPTLRYHSSIRFAG